MSDVTDEERRELEHVERRLIAEFAADLPVNIVRECVHDVVAHWAGARVRHFVPLLTERFARERLREIVAHTEQELASRAG